MTDFGDLIAYETKANANPDFHSAVICAIEASLPEQDLITTYTKLAPHFNQQQKDQIILLAASKGYSLFAENSGRSVARNRNSDSNLLLQIDSSTISPQDFHNTLSLYLNASHNSDSNELFDLIADKCIDRVDLVNEAFEVAFIYCSIPLFKRLLRFQYTPKRTPQEWTLRIVNRMIDSQSFDDYQEFKNLIDWTVDPETQIEALNLAKSRKSDKIYNYLLEDQGFIPSKP